MEICLAAPQIELVISARINALAHGFSKNSSR